LARAAKYGEINGQVHFGGLTKMNLLVSAKAEKREMWNILLRFAGTVKCGFVFKQEHPDDTH